MCINTASRHIIHMPEAFAKSIYDLRPATAGWAFGFLRDKCFSRTHYLRFFSETSGIDVTLLGAHNDIRSTRISNGNMPN